MSSLRQLAALLRLGRTEGPVLGGLLVLAGGALSGAGLSAYLTISAVLMATCAMGFVYSLNGISDTVEDTINKPDRPLVAGTVSLRAARVYVAVLLSASVAYPFFLYDAWQPRLLVLGVLLIGALYSLEPLRLKRVPPAATLSITLLLHLPLLLGLWHTNRITLPIWLVSTVAFCLAVLPLKDLEDAQGDRRAGIGNWTAWIGARPLLVWCIVCSSLASVGDVLLMSDTEPLWPTFVAFQTIPMVVIASFVATRSDSTRIYRTIVFSVLAVAGLFPLLLGVIGRSGW